MTTSLTNGARGQQSGAAATGRAGTKGAVDVGARPDAKAVALIGSLGDLSSMAGMPSEPTLRRLIAEHEDFPILSRGTNGRAFEIDLKAAAEFVCALQRADEDRARAHREAVNQLSLELLGEDALARAGDGINLTPDERVKLMQEELLRIKVAQQRGELVRAAEVEARLADVMVWFREFAVGFSGKCAKRMAFSREQLAVIDMVIRQGLLRLSEQMEGLHGDVAPGDAAGDDAASVRPGA